MTAQTLTLAAFVSARLEEDEAAARHQLTYDRELEITAYRRHGRLLPTPLTVGMHDPARVLAEVAAKRAILGSLDMTACPCQTASRCVLHDASSASAEFARERYADRLTEVVLSALALPFANHPDYDERWRP